MAVYPALFKRYPAALVGLVLLSGIPCSTVAILLGRLVSKCGRGGGNVVVGKDSINLESLLICR